jgi:hypothetical protein
LTNGLVGRQTAAASSAADERGAIRLHFTATSCHEVSLDPFTAFRQALRGFFVLQLGHFGLYPFLILLVLSISDLLLLIHFFMLL